MWIAGFVCVTACGGPDVIGPVPTPMAVRATPNGQTELDAPELARGARLITPTADGQRLILRSDTQIWIVDVASGAERFRRTIDGAIPPWVGARGNYVLVFDDGAVVAIDVHGGREIAERVLPDPNAVLFGRTAADGTHVWLDEARRLHRWHLPTDTLDVTPIRIPEQPPFQARGPWPLTRTQVLVEGDPTQVLDMSSGRVVGTLSGRRIELPASFEQVALDPEGRRLGLISREGYVLVVSTDTWEVGPIATFLALGEEERNADQHHGDAHWSPVFHGDDVWIVRPGGVQGLRPDMRGGREIGGVPSELAAVGLDGSTLIGVIDSSSSAIPRIEQWSLETTARLVGPDPRPGGTLLAIDEEAIWSYRDAGRQQDGAFLERTSLRTGELDLVAVPRFEFEQRPVRASHVYVPPTLEAAASLLAALDPDCDPVEADRELCREQRGGGSRVVLRSAAGEEVYHLDLD
ncbi:MAG: hypothetical protein KC619_09700, partial [Myxococcales bacterium]|nr:hypothetical protein [Myxococcales bacterium]